MSLKEAMVAQISGLEMALAVLESDMSFIRANNNNGKAGEQTISVFSDILRESLLSKLKMARAWENRP